MRKEESGKGWRDWTAELKVGKSSSLPDINCGKGRNETDRGLKEGTKSGIGAGWNPDGHGHSELA